MYYKILRLKNLASCARALLDVQTWRAQIQEEDTTPLFMTSSIADFLQKCPATTLPCGDGRKECHICHKMGNAWVNDFPGRPPVDSGLFRRSKFVTDRSERPYKITRFFNVIGYHGERMFGRKKIDCSTIPNEIIH